MKNIFKFILVILLTSCASSKDYSKDVVIEYPKGKIYMIDKLRFIVYDESKMSVYYVEYFRGELYVTNTYKLR